VKIFMKRLSKIIGLVFIAAVLLLLGYYGRNLFKANEQARKYFISQIQKHIGSEEGVSIRSLNISFNQVSVRGIDLEFQSGLYSLFIDEITIGYSLPSLIRNKFSPHKIAREIVVIRPELAFYPQFPDTIEQSSFTLASLYDLVESLSNVYDEFSDYIQRIRIMDGSVIQQRSSGQSHILFSDVDGFLHLSESGATRLELTSAFLSNQQQKLRLTGRINGFTKSGNLTFQVDEIPINMLHSYYELQEVSWQDGSISGEVSLLLNSESIKNNSFILTGDVKIRNGALFLSREEILIDGIYLDGKIHNTDIEVLELHHRLSNLEIHYSGTITDFFNPQFELAGYTQVKKLSEFKHQYFPEKTPSIDGSLRGDFWLTGLYYEPKLSGSLHISKPLVNGIQFDDIRTDFQLTKDNLSFFNFRTGIGKSELTSEGDIIFNGTKDINFVLDISQDISWLTEIIPASVPTPKFLNIRVGVTGNPDALAGGYIAKIIDPDEEVNIVGEFQWENDTFTFEGQGNDTGLQFSGMIDKSENFFRIHQIFNPFQFLGKLIEFSPLNDLHEFLDSEFSFEKVDGRYSFSGKGTKKGDSSRSRNIFNLSGAIAQETNESAYRCIVQYYPEPEMPVAVTITGKVNRKEVSLDRFTISGVGGIQGKLSREEDRLISGIVNFNTSISYLNRLIQRELPIFEDGLFSGDLIIDGDLSKPTVEGWITLDEGRILGQEGYHGKIVVKPTKSKQINIEEIIFANRENVLIKGWGQIKQDPSDMYVLLQGEKLNSPLLLNAFHVPPVIDGNMDFNLEVFGEPSRPYLKGEIVISEGALCNVPFTELKVSMSEGSGTPQAIFEQIPSLLSIPSSIYLDRLEVKRDNLKITGKGFAPLNQQEEMSIEIEAEGDILSILPDLDGFFRQAQGRGMVKLHLAGTLDSPTIGSGELSVENGSMEFRSVINEVKNINAHITLQPGERWIQFNDISGLIDGREVHIKNIYEAPIELSDGQKMYMEPMIFTDDGLTWGVMSFHTPDEGVRLNIPRLMKKGESVVLKLSGMKEGESFYLSGPLDHPVIRGQAHIPDIEFTYPFLEGSGRKKSRAERFLELVNWDVNVTYGGDIQYYRRIPGPFAPLAADADVYLKLDDNLTGLYFQGSLDEETFSVNGSIQATRGTVEFFPHTFHLEFAKVTFDRFNQLPLVTGRARTTIRPDSSSFSSPSTAGSSIPVDVYVEFYTIDKDTEEGQFGGRWEDIKLRLTMTDKSSLQKPGLEESQEEILRLLGYIGEDLITKVPEMAGSHAENALIRPLFRPVEVRLRSLFHLDEFRFQPTLAQNLTRSFFSKGLQHALGTEPVQNQTSSGFLNPAYLFNSSYLVLGKYISDDFYFTYKGQLISGLNEQDKELFGIRHLFGIEYRIAPGFLFEMQHELDKEFSRYSSTPYDTRFWLRHYFTLSD